MKVPVYASLLNPKYYFNTGHYVKSSVILFIALISILYVVGLYKQVNTLAPSVIECT